MNRTKSGALQVLIAALKDIVNFFHLARQCRVNQIGIMEWTLLHAPFPQVVGLHQYPVKPSGADINENFLSEEAMQEFGIKEQLVSWFDLGL